MVFYFPTPFFGTLSLDRPGKGGFNLKLVRKKSENDITKVFSLPIDEIVPNPNQPRRTFSSEGLQELASSIQQLGVLQPLTVRPLNQGWELIAGERRLRASRLAGLTHVPCIVLNASEEQSSLMALVENIQRRDLDFLEEALALNQLIQAYSLSQEDCARRIGKSQSAIANKLRLLRLPPHVLDLLRDNGFTERHARALLRLDNAAAQDRAARWIVDHDLTVAKTEEYIESLLAQAKAPRRKPTFILKDVRLFLNTVDRGLTMMKSAGVHAQCGREDTDDAILLTIRIPKRV